MIKKAFYNIKKSDLTMKVYSGGQMGLERYEHLRRRGMEGLL